MADASPPKPEVDKLRDLARELECDEDEAAFDEKLKQIVRPDAPKVCPECSHQFQGSGWDGIDAHWRAKHEDVMPYEDAWPLLKNGDYRR